MDARSAFETLVRRHQDAVCAIAYAVTRDRARSEELAQEAFLIAWRNRDRVDTVTAAWICGIARNLARNAARRRREVVMESEPAASSPDARDVLIDRELQERAAAMLDELPESYREAIVLYYRGDQSIAAVADALGVTPETARQRVHRGREKLRDALAPVVSALGATRPGAAFTAACVAAWALHGTHADAAPHAALPAAIGTSLGGVFWAVGGALASAALVIGIAVSRTTPTVAAPARATPAAASISLRARFPAMITTRHAPQRFRALVVPIGTVPGPQTLDIDVNQAPFRDIARLFSMTLDTPMWIDPSIDATVNVKADHTPALELLDETLAQAGAIRTEVAALRLVPNGRTDAAQLGGDSLTLHVRDAPVDEVLRVIEAKLYMPIGHVESDARVTIDIDDAPAGKVLEAVLAQAHLGYETTTGFAITPDD